MPKSAVLRLFTFEVLISEGHLKEVHPKAFHKEENSKQSWEDTSYIGQNVHKFQILPCDRFGDGGPFYVKIGLLCGGHLYRGPVLHWLAANAAFFLDVLEWPQTMICFEIIYV
jgi:hypothetical protein